MSLQAKVELFYKLKVFSTWSRSLYNYNTWLLSSSEFTFSLGRSCEVSTVPESLRSHSSTANTLCPTTSQNALNDPMTISLLKTDLKYFTWKDTYVQLYPAEFKLCFKSIAQSIFYIIYFCGAGNWTQPAHTKPLLYTVQLWAPTSNALTPTQRSSNSAFFDDYLKVIKLHNFIRAEF